MAETEKITINLSVVDLGKIDLLVEEGFYSNRTDFIRAAIRSQMYRHEDAVQEVITRKAFAIGVMVYSHKGLSKRLEKGESLDFRVVGLLVLENDVTPELALATIEQVHVLGVFEAPADVKAALAEAGRIK